MSCRGSKACPTRTDSFGGEGLLPAAKCLWCSATRLPVSPAAGYDPPMKYRFSVLAAPLLLLACGGEVATGDDGANAGGGANTGGGANAGDVGTQKDRYVEICERIGASGCPGRWATDYDECMEEMHEGEAMAADNCEEEFEAAIACMAVGEYTCDEHGDAMDPACMPAIRAFEGCVGFGGCEMSGSMSTDGGDEICEVNCGGQRAECVRSPNGSFTCECPRGGPNRPSFDVPSCESVTRAQIVERCGEQIGSE